MWVYTEFLRNIKHIGIGQYYSLLWRYHDIKDWYMGLIFLGRIPLPECDFTDPTIQRVETLLLLFMV